MLPNQFTRFSYWCLMFLVIKWYLCLLIIMCLHKFCKAGASSGYWTSARHRSVGSGSRWSNSALCWLTTQTAWWSLLVWKAAGSLVAYTVHFISGDVYCLLLWIFWCLYEHLFPHPNTFYFFQNAFELATFLWSLVRIFLIFMIRVKLFGQTANSTRICRMRTYPACCL